MTKSSTVEKVTRMYGSTAARCVEGADACYIADLDAYADSLPGLSDSQFVHAASIAIFESVTSARFTGFAHHDAKAEMCGAEGRRRHTAAGHSPDCRGSNLYGRAYNDVVTDYGYSGMATASECSCGRVALLDQAN